MKLIHRPWMFIQVLGTPFVEMYHGIKAEYLQIEQARAERDKIREAHLRMIPADNAKLRHEMWTMFVDAARGTPRMYFAPLTGAVKGLRHAFFGRR